MRHPTKQYHQLCHQEVAPGSLITPKKSSFMVPIQNQRERERDIRIRAYTTKMKQTKEDFYVESREGYNFLCVKSNLGRINFLEVTQERTSIKTMHKNQYLSIFVMKPHIPKERIFLLSQKRIVCFLYLLNVQLQHSFTLFCIY